MDRQATKAKLRAAQRGDMEAFADLFEPIRPKVFAVACRLVGADEAEDIVMDTFLKAWQALPSFKGRAALGTWVCRIARNKAMDCLRSARVRHTELMPTEDVGTRRDASEQSEDLPPVAMIRDEVRANVFRAVEQLSAAHKQVILLRYVDDLSYAEIASATGVGIGTVMSRLFHAKRRLRGIMEEESPGPAEGGRNDDEQTS
jgi:RNA polymerase sigma-70 factor (ECF subfamily)